MKPRGNRREAHPPSSGSLALSWVTPLDGEGLCVDNGLDRSLHAVNSSNETDGIPAIGDLIGGRFRITAMLGQGGMGVVLAGEHLDLRQDVAIKVLQPALAKEPDALARFLREARAAASIKSRHAVRIHDVGTTDAGTPYMVMERLHGIGVDELLEQEGPLPVERAVQIAVEAAEAIAEANTMGIIHRDVKPSNLFLANDGSGAQVVKVLDFGISKRVTVEGGHESASLTAPQTLLGSPHYMSPEQLRDARSVDERSDVWGLGVTLFELVTGRVPFQCDSIPELCAMIFTSPAPRADELRASVPSALADILAECLTKQPDERIPSVAALAGRLAPFCRGEALTTAEQLARTARATYDSSANTRVEPPAAQGRRRSALVVVAGLVIVALAMALRLRATEVTPAGPSTGNPSTLSGATSASTATSTAASSELGAAAPSTSAGPGDAGAQEIGSAQLSPSPSASVKAPLPNSPLAPAPATKPRGLKGIKLMD